MKVFLISLFALHGATALKIASDSADMEAPPVSPGSGASSAARPVFYAIVMGKLAKRHQVKLWLTSLRQVGAWKGTVVIVTDNANCIETTLKESSVDLLGGEKLHSDDELDVYPGLSAKGGGKVHIVKVPSVGCCSEHQIRKMKQHKTKAWTNVEKAKIDHQVSSIIYVDEDVVIGDDLYRTGFFQEVRDLEKDDKKGGYLLAMFKDIHHESKLNVHTGVVVMFPGAATEACLHNWGKKLMTISEKGSLLKEEVPADFLEAEEAAEDTSKFDFEEEAEMNAEDAVEETAETAVMGPDQRALVATGACRMNGGIKFLNRYIMFPQNGHLKRNYTANFVHFTNTNRWNAVSDSVKNKWFTERLHLPADLDPMGHTKC